MASPFLGTAATVKECLHIASKVTGSSTDASCGLEEAAHTSYSLMAVANPSSWAFKVVA